ncbi:MAG: hypothetical protein IT307_10685 [Chloroflexi bacterium]|nr:hypothetical protein [Chloroflexota bacterium]
MLDIFTDTKQLFLDNTSLNDQNIQYLSGMRLLQKLHLIRGPFGEEALQFISGLAELEHLNLQTIKKARSLDFLIGASKLKSLIIDISSGNAVDISAIAGLKFLKRLDLSGMGLNDANISTLSTMSSLEPLDISMSPISDVGLRKIETMIELREIRLWETNATQQGIDRLKEKLRGCIVYNFPNKGRR